jgi:hypothetical protein
MERETVVQEAELCYAPQFGSAKDPVNMAGMYAMNVLEVRCLPVGSVKCSLGAVRPRTWLNKKYMIF